MPTLNVENIVIVLILQLAADSATGGVNNTEPTGELFDLMTRVGAIEETAKNEGIYINLLTVPLNNCNHISEISNELPLPFRRQ